MNIRPNCCVEECDRAAEYRMPHLIAGINKLPDNGSLCAECYAEEECPFEDMRVELSKVLTIGPLVLLVLEYERPPLYIKTHDYQYTSNLFEWMWFLCRWTGWPHSGFWLVNCNPASSLYGYVLYNGEEGEFEYLCTIGDLSDDLSFLKQQIQDHVGSRSGSESGGLEDMSDEEEDS